MKKSLMKGLSKREKWKFEKEKKEQNIKSKKEEKRFINLFFNIFTTGDVDDGDEKIKRK